MQKLFVCGHFGTTDRSVPFTAHGEGYGETGRVWGAQTRGAALPGFGISLDGTSMVPEEPAEQKLVFGSLQVHRARCDVHILLATNDTYFADPRDLPT